MSAAAGVAAAERARDGADWTGRAEAVREDRADARLADGLAATLGAAHPGDGPWPPLWHWALFQDWRPAESLGADGHPRRGGFLPALPDLPRRMWAGGRLRFPGDVRTGDALRRTSAVRRVEEKRGASSGRFALVTVAHAVEGPRGRVVEEELDLVYRAADAPAVRASADAAPDWPGAVEAVVTPDPVVLFRYSALTGNGHRIHYDHPYATGVEGYPGLVVHGPLQATWLAAHALVVAGEGARLASFSYRGLRPCFADRPIRLLGARGDGATVRLETRDDGGRVCQRAEAVLA